MTAQRLWWPTCAAIAMAAPASLAFNLPPSATFLNQAAALVGWGGFLIVAAAVLPARARLGASGLTALLAALAVLLAAALASPFWAHLPSSLGLSGAGLIAAAALTAYVAASAQSSGAGSAAFRALCIGMVVAGILSSLIGIAQVFAPQWPDGDWVARTYVPGRAVGNMRQPNHLSSLLVWATIASVWLAEIGVLKRWLGALLGALFIFVIVLSASRTGTVSIVLLAVWALLDKRLSRPTRLLLLLAPVAYGVFWLGTSAWADYSHQLFGGETRFTTKGDISSSRWGIWSNTLALIRMHPWFGVGFGEFNFAWTLTPFPGRPVAFFDHTHNLILQFAVELGLPLAALVLALFGAALVSAWRAAQDSTRRAALVMVLMILLHSLLEYPLWYAYFLLPAAFAFGLCLGPPADEARPLDAPAGAAMPASGTRPLLVAAMLLMLGGLASVVDYSRVVAIFAPAEGAPPLAQRIADGRRSVFFSHQADYAAATTAEHPADALAAFRAAPHNLLDARLMQAWAKALDESGDADRARYLAQRLKEFHNGESAEFFAPCAEPPEHGVPPPFQCEAPTRTFGYQDFR
ncbi:MAG TPA: Wzy polymerase domain-containing protein [Burkholderiaceae bacterium]|jgi:O-antigen ligase